MKTIEEIRNTLAATAQTEFSSKEVARIIGISKSNITFHLRNYPELKPEKSGMRNCYIWTAKEIIRFVEFHLRNLSRHNSKNEMPSIPVSVTAIPEPKHIEPVNTEYISPIDILIQIDKTMTEDPNVKAYYDMKNAFERMNETALQKMFAPLLERFKYAYICKVIPEIQSQMLTCIAKGKLRGMEKYGMDFNAFLKLVKFAHDNYVPLDAVDDQKGVN